MKWRVFIIGFAVVLVGIAMLWKRGVSPRTQSLSQSAELPGAAPSAQHGLVPADTSTLTDYLVQSACVDADGKLAGELPVDAGCTRSRLLDEDDPMPWRKHDWGGIGGPVAGWQASDAVLARRDGVSFVDQTFDFGAPATDDAGRPDAFYRFDGNDGGDAIAIVGDTVSVFLTQDGGKPGLQWFIGSGCGRPGPGRYASWVLFKSDVGADWRSVVAELGDDPEDICPTRFNHAFTRYRLVSEAFPLVRLDPSGVPVRWTVSLPTVLSEHYDAPTLAKSHALERFYYARGLGKVRWEAWSPDDRKSSQADAFARTGRCPELADSGAPDSGWKMLDCRMWTNIVSDPARADWRVRDFNWPPGALTLKQAN